MTYHRNRERHIALFPPDARLVFMLLTPIYCLFYETFHLCRHVNVNWFARSCSVINTIRRHHAAHHCQPIMMECNTNLTYPIANWYDGTSDLDRGLPGHLPNGYDARSVKPEFATAQGAELDARAKPA